MKLARVASTFVLLLCCQSFAGCGEEEFALTINNTLQWKVTLSFVPAGDFKPSGSWVVGANETANIPVDRFDSAQGGEFAYGGLHWMATTRGTPDSPCGDVDVCEVDDGFVEVIEGVPAVINVDNVEGN